MATCSLKTLSRFCLGGDDPDSGFSVAIEPYNSDVEELITDGLISPTGPSSTLETALRYHLSWVADMMLRGQAVYEIDLLSDADGKKVAFRTGWIPPGHHRQTQRTIYPIRARGTWGWAKAQGLLLR